MTMQIKTISLYGKNGERRDIEFELGAVNIITGASKRGKTSLIDIVEYCLGATECTVKEGYIRQTVEWYAIKLQFPDCQFFIARAAPLLGAKADPRAYFSIGNCISTPKYDEITHSTNIDSIVSFLTRKIGIPEQVTDVPDGQTRPAVKLSFRHSRYYLFQSQNEIANNEILFHQQAKPHITQNIKDTLPYFIGAAEDSRLADIDRLRNLKRERNKLHKQITEIESLKGDGLQKGYALLTEATELGLHVQNNSIINDSYLIDSLMKISNWSPKEEALPNDKEQLINIEREYQRLLQEQSILKARIREAQEYEGLESGFEKAVAEQSYRLNSIKLFEKLERNNNSCPICESPRTGSSTFERIIKKSLSELDKKLDGISKSKPRVTSYISRLKEEQANITKDLRQVRLLISKIRETDDELSKKVDIDILRARLAGKASLYIDSINWNKDVSWISDQINLLDEQITFLSEKLNPALLKENLLSQLNCIAEDMTKWARELCLEHSNNRIRLDHGKLTVVADTPNGIIPLSNMGSGANWVGYHLVTHLALAKWFIEQARPVGRFLFIDQPSQVYFPSEKSETGNINEIEGDEDRESVRKMFKWIFEVVRILSPHFQLIITDHADIDEEWFQNAVRDEKWRGDYALIPKSWYENILD